MKVSFNTYNYYPVSMGTERHNLPQKRVKAQANRQIKSLLVPLYTDKEATIPAKSLMKGINPNSNDVFDTFTKIDDVTRKIDFVKSPDDWNACLLDEIEEFNIARQEWEQDKNQQNFDHMEEEMGDIFFTAASIAKNSGIDGKEAFKATNRKFFNRINIMERLFVVPSKANKTANLKDAGSAKRRALWESAKKKIYAAQAKRYEN